jgi:hypothetical protein
VNDRPGNDALGTECTPGLGRIVADGSEIRKRR